MRNCKGLTLIELVIAISILGLVMISVSQVLDLGLANWGRTDVRTEAEQNIRIALERIKSEAVLAYELDTGSDTGTLILVYKPGTRITYSLGSAVSETPEHLQGCPLERRFNNGQPQAIADYLHEVRFSYYALGAEGLQSTSPVNATYLEIYLSAQIPDGELVENRTGVALRGKFLPRQ